MSTGDLPGARGFRTGGPVPPETALMTSAIVLTVEVFGKNLVVRPVKNGDARLKHTATEKTAAVPVAEAESTKVLPRSALRHRGESLESPPGGKFTASRLVCSVAFRLLTFE